MECSKDYYIHNYKFLENSFFNEELFQDGISIYEVIRIENGIPLFLESHLNRLFHTAKLSRLNINESYCDLESLIDELIKKNITYNGKIKLVIHYNSKNKSKEKDLLIYFTSHYFPSNEEYKQGVSVGTCNVVRENPNAKLLNSKARRRANNVIAEKKFFEALLINKEKFITEGSRSNVFFIQGEDLITPPSSDILIGITRSNIIGVCRSNNINVIEKKILYSDIKKMNSSFLSGTSLKVLPIKQIDDIMFDTENLILRTIMKLYDESIEKYISSKLT